MTKFTLLVVLSMVGMMSSVRNTNLSGLSTCSAIFIWGSAASRASIIMYSMAFAIITSVLISDEPKQWSTMVAHRSYGYRSAYAG
jgi:hypothetical protein